MSNSGSLLTFCSYERKVNILYKIANLLFLVLGCHNTYIREVSIRYLRHHLYGSMATGIGENFASYYVLIML